MVMSKTEITSRECDKIDLQKEEIQSQLHQLLTAQPSKFTQLLQVSFLIYTMKTVIVSAMSPSQGGVRAQVI